MPSIDNRVVRMDFDNKKFEENVKTTTSSLDKLKNALKFDGATDGLKNVSETAKSVTFEPISNAIERVRANVSVASVAIIASIMNITNRVVNMGVEMGKSLTLEPLMGGFQEYETNMNSIQTVLANTSKQGTTLEQVNDALDKLNAYSDQTIYNFGQMAKNVGTFTAAGVDLDTSVSSIKGISNIAAMSGANAEQASSAMYQLSQALASGKVQLRDWMSMESNSMGSRVVQEALFETGKAMNTIQGVNMGTTFDDWTKSAGSFRETLQSDWLTTEVLTKTLTAFTGDLNAEQLVGLGYTKEQALEFEKMAKTAKDAATIVKTFSQLKSTVSENIGSGWSSSFRIIIGDFEEAKVLFTTIFQVINNIVGPITEARNAMLNAWKAFGGRTVLLQGLIYGFQAIAAVVRTVSDGFRDVFPKKTLPELLQLTKKFKDFALSLKPNEETLKNIRSIARGVFSVFSIAITIVSSLAKMVFNFSKAVTGASKVLPFLAKIGDFLFYLKQGVDSGVVGFIQKLGDSLSNIASSAITTVLDFISNIFDRIGGRAEQAASGVSKLGAIFSWLGNKISGIPDVLKKTFSKENFNTSIDVLNVGLLGGLVYVFAKFFKRILAFDFGSGFIEKLTNIFEQLGKTLAAFQLKIKADAIRSIAVSIAIMAASLVALSLIDSQELMKALVAMSLVFGLMAGMMKFLDGIAQNGKDSTNILKLAGGLTLIGISIWFLSRALKNFGDMDWTEIGKGLFGLVGALAAIGLSMRLMPSKGDLFKAGAGIFLISKAAKNLSFAVESFAKMSLRELVQGLLGLGIMLTLLVKVINSTEEKKMMAVGAGLILLSFAIDSLIGAVWALGNMQLSTLVQGLVALSIIMVGLSFALKSFPDNMLQLGAGMLLVAASVSVLGLSIALLGSMDLGNLVKGILAIGIVIFILTSAVEALNVAAVGVDALILVAGSLLILATAIKIIGGMPIGNLLGGLLGIAAIIAIIGISALLLEPALPLILAMAIAFGALGIAIAAIGLGAMALAHGIDMVRESGMAGLSSIGGIIGVVISRIGDFVSTLFRAFMGVVRRFFTELPNMIRHLLSVLTQVLPTVLNFIVKFITNVLIAIRNAIPQLVPIVIEVIATFINTIAANLGLIISAGTNLIVSYIKGVDNGSQLIIDAATDLIVNFINGIRNTSTRIINAGRNLVVAIIEGIDNAVNDPNDGIVPAITNLIIHFINAVADSYGDIIDAGVKAVAKFLEGLGKNAQEITEAAGKFILDVLNAVESSIEKYGPQIRNAAIKIGLAIIDGMTFGMGTRLLKFFGVIDDAGAKAIDAARESVDAHSPSRAFMEIGKDMMDGLTIGIARNSSVIDATRRVGSDAVKALNNSLSLVSSSLENVNEFSPTIRPVLDLSNVQNGSKVIGNMFAGKTIDTNVSFAKASFISDMEKQNAKNSAVVNSPQVNEIKFEQTINSPTALSTSEIYRNTKTQISMAKEELRIA